jgi:hypothetical protein
VLSTCIECSILVKFERELNNAERDLRIKHYEYIIKSLQNQMSEMEKKLAEENKD